MSHKIRSGLLAKKTWRDADLFRMFHELTPSQMSFFRECVVQEMGGKKSAFWGHQKIPFKIKHNCSKKDLLFFLEALNHPTHIFARKMSLNKNAAGFGASVGRAVVKVGKTVGKYAAKGAKWMAAHAKQIMGGLDTAVGLGVQTVTMAYQMGLLDDQSDSTLLGLTQMAGMAHDIYHADDAVAAEEKEEKKTDTEKPGRGMIQDLHKAAIMVHNHPESVQKDGEHKAPVSHEPIDIDKVNKRRHDRRQEVDKPKWMQEMDHQIEIRKFVASHRGKRQLTKKAVAF